MEPIKRTNGGRFNKGTNAWTYRNSTIKASENIKVGAELGGTGTIITDGILSGTDENVLWTGTRRVDTADKMRDQDATVKNIYELIKQTILAANWYIEPASQDKKDIEIADRVHAMLFEDMDRSFQDTLEEMILYLPYGSYPWEIVYRMTADGLIGWEKFGPRHPSTILRYETEKGNPGITQILPDGSEPSIPSEKLVFFVNEKEGDNWDGKPIFRPAYSAYDMKNMLYRIATIAAERQGVGIPQIVMPNGAKTSDVTEVKKLLKNVRANEAAYFLGKKTATGDEIRLEMTDMKGNTTKDPMDLILHFDRQISKVVGAEFVELGASKASGSRAMDESKTATFLERRNAEAKYIAETFSKQAINRLVDFNWQVTEYPRLVFSDMTRINYDALPDLVNAGLVTATPEVEDYLRNDLNLPDKPEEEVDRLPEQDPATPNEDVDKLEDGDNIPDQDLEATLLRANDILDTFDK